MVSSTILNCSAALRDSFIIFIFPDHAAFCGGGIIFTIYVHRVVFLFGFKISHTDLRLLSSLEHGRIAEQLHPVVHSLAAAGAAAAAAAQHSSATTYAQHRHYSDLFQQLSAYCGQYNTAGDGKHRFDVSGALEQMESLQSLRSGTSAMVYHIDPPASTFSTPNEDLQVRVM